MVNWLRVGWLLLARGAPAGIMNPAAACSTDSSSSIAGATPGIMLLQPIKSLPSLRPGSSTGFTAGRTKEDYFHRLPSVWYPVLAHYGRERGGERQESQVCWVVRLGFRRHRRGYCMECQGTEACWEQFSFSMFCCVDVRPPLSCLSASAEYNNTLDNRGLTW